MDLNKLLAYRKLAPGIVLLILAIPLMYEDYEELLDFIGGLTIKNFLFIIPIIIIGTIYKSLKLTEIIWDPIRIDIDNNIKNKILNEYNFTDLEDKKLRKGKTLINIFFQIVDQDESLKQKKKIVYENGLILTTLCDLGVLSIICAIYSITYGLVFNNLYNIKLVYLYFAIFGFSIVFLKIRTITHKTLGDDQLEIIIRSKKTELKQKLNEAL